MKSLGKFFVDVMINLKSALGTFVREYSNPEKLPPSAELSFSSGDRHQRSRDLLPTTQRWCRQGRWP